MSDPLPIGTVMLECIGGPFDGSRFRSDMPPIALDGFYQCHELKPEGSGFPRRAWKWIPDETLDSWL